ncbi:MAG TPA: hypothetical protein VG817_03110, partial [Gemmatimonadales bacterium]|nr:hypothetical protein [Gemmatimonadales bacterium]
VPTGAPGAAARKVADAMVGDRLGPVPPREPGVEVNESPAAPAVPLTAAARKDYPGKYYGEEVNATITLSVAGDTLKFERPGAPVLAMEPVEKDHFTVDGWIHVRFQRQGGQVTGFVVDMGRIRGVKFSRTSR